MIEQSNSNRRFLNSAQPLYFSGIDSSKNIS
jgi:hypothetical protein